MTELRQSARSQPPESRGVKIRARSPPRGIKCLAIRDTPRKDATSRISSPLAWYRESGEGPCSGADGARISANDKYGRAPRSGDSGSLHPPASPDLPRSTRQGSSHACLSRNANVNANCRP